jgi:hypothetical protein
VSAALSQVNVTVDTTSPTIAITSNMPTLRAGQTAVITFTLSEPSITFGLDDITFSGGTLSDFRANAAGDTYTATFTPTADVATTGSVSVAAATFTDLAGNANVSGAELAPVIDVDTIVPPEVVGFSTTAPDGTYGIGQAIEIEATLSEPVRPGGTLAVTLNSGAIVLLAVATDTTMVGTYVVQPGEVAADLDVVAITPNGSLVDLAGNPLTNTAPPASGGLGERHNLSVAGAITVPPAAGVSTDPQLVPNLRRPLSRIPITFTTAVTGVSTSSFRLYLNGRSVSLRGARIRGSGDTYTLLLPRRRTMPRGIYTLEVVADGGIRSAINGAAMTETVTFYWGRGRSVGISRQARLRAFARFR